MTTDTAKAKPATPGVKLLSAILYAAGVTAVVAFLITSTLGFFAVSVPFVGAWVAVLTALGSARYVTAEVADVWHKSRVKADVDLIAATMAAQEMIHQQHSPNLGGLGEFLAKLNPEHTDNEGSGGYL